MIDNAAAAAVQEWARSEPLIRQVWFFGSRFRGSDWHGQPTRPDSDLDLAIVIDEPSDEAELQAAWSALRRRGESYLASSLPWRAHLELHRGDLTPNLKSYLEDCSRIAYRRGESEITAHQAEWVRTDEWTDVASSLEHLAMSLRLVNEKPLEWKWATIACHSALQGTLICVLSGSNGIGCLTDKAKTRFMNWLDASRSDPNLKPPDDPVAEFPVLLERAGDSKFMSEFGGLPVSLDPDTARDMERLHFLRNRFTHFRPSSWSIAMADLPQIMHSAIRLAQGIMFGHPACTHRLDSNQRCVFSARFQEISRALEALGIQGLPRD